MIPVATRLVSSRSIPVGLTIGTRGSALARWQTDWIIARLQAAWPDLPCEVKLFRTSGDKTLDKPLPEIGGKGLFTLELESALSAGGIDIAVQCFAYARIDVAAQRQQLEIGPGSEQLRRATQA